ncbi:MAG: hypothetical protein ACEQSB_06100 [Undibacterium sp.]
MKQEEIDDEGEFWRNVREVNKQEHREWRNRIAPVVHSKVKQLEAGGHAIKWLTEWQFRMDGWLDIFWQSKRFHDITKNRRGSYRDIMQFMHVKSSEDLKADYE